MNSKYFSWFEKNSEIESSVLKPEFRPKLENWHPHNCYTHSSVFEIGYSYHLQHITTGNLLLCSK